MTASVAHSFLVHPSKSADTQPSIGGTTIPTAGDLYDMLAKVYDNSSTECDIDISFNHSAAGTQQNDCRDLLVEYVKNPSLPNGRAIATRLQGVTTRRSGLGLLFLLYGKEGRNHKLVVSRFPADSGILAEEDEDDLNVEFIKKIFMKSARTYKAALYSGSSTTAGFWDGKAVDKQINSQTLALSDYWIRDFLASDLKTTAAAGSKRLANAIRGAIKATDDLSIKEELVSAARLAPSLQGQSISMRSFASRFSLSDAAKEALKGQLRNGSQFTEQFSMSRQEFERHIALQTKELDNGAILIAPALKYDDVFSETPIQGDDGRVQISTQGKIVDVKLRKGRG